ncbi:MAG: hypothetical protein KDD44_00450 [Bdellovibrionales bacterium]|nr:hypothetical protein [Bdellovibrionales bacterium]
MKDPRVKSLATSFAGYWNPQVVDLPLYRLDGTFPSLGTIDLMTFHLRFKKEPLDADRRIVASSAAYITSFAYEVWSHFPSEPLVTARFEEEPEPRIVLSAKKHVKATSPLMSVSVSDEFLGALIAPKQPFPVFGEHARQLRRDDNRAALFAYGLGAGLCPYGEGAWRDIEPSAFKENILFFSTYLANSIAVFYGRNFPGEELGQDPDLYLESMVFPPPGYNEPTLFARGVDGTVKKLLADKRGPEDLLAFALNLAHIPDETASAVGFAIAAALPQCSAEQLSYLKFRFGLKPADLKGAAVIARAALGQPLDWLERAKADALEEARAIFEREKVLDMMPLCTLPFERLVEPPFEELATHLSWSSGAGAQRLLGDFLQKSPHDIDLQLQAAYLEFVSGAAQEAEHRLAAMEGKSLENHFLYHRLRGSCAAMLRRPAEAIPYFQKALEIGESDVEQVLTVTAQLATALLQLNQPDSAVTIIEAVQGRRSTVDLDLLRVGLLQMIGEQERAESALRVLARKAPLDRRVFGAVLEYLIR